jgi:hypothetical protein
MERSVPRPNHASKSPMLCMTQRKCISARAAWSGSFSSCSQFIMHETPKFTQ